MYPQQRELSYRRSAVAGASWIGLVIALYDTLSGNLRRSAAAIRNKNIEARCAEVNHAMLVLGQLESMSNGQSGQGNDELANSLSVFYSYLRARMMEASIEQSAALMEAQIELVLQVRSAWQQRDLASSQTVPANLLGGEGVPSAERISLSQSM